MLPTTAEELDAFYAFGRRALAERSDVSFDDLVDEWEAQREQGDANAAIREGIADVKAGRTAPAVEALGKIRGELGLDEP